jgi:hypothetical protein
MLNSNAPVNWGSRTIGSEYRNDAKVERKKSAQRPWDAAESPRCRGRPTGNPVIFSHGATIEVTHRNAMVLNPKVHGL